MIRFPDPEYAAAGGVVHWGGSLEPDNLAAAYRSGIFPWPVDGWPLPWFCPERRAILEFDRLHIPRTLLKVQRLSPFRLTIDAAFSTVIRACANRRRPGEDGTWITPEMIDAYTELHRLGHAHSIEAWDGDEFAGGLYGVDAGGAFAGESMVYYKPNASKLALLHLIEHLKERGVDWLDVQVMTPHIHALGAREISRGAFLKKLADAQARDLKLF